MRLEVFFACVASLMLEALVAGAGPSDVSITFESRSDCGSREAFEARLAERLGSPAPTPEQPIVNIEVSVEQTEGQVSGRVLFRDRDGRATERYIEAATCREAVDGLALIAAMALQRDPEAPAPEPPKPQPEPEPVPHREPIPHRPLPAAEEDGFAFDLVSSALALRGPLPDMAPGLGLDVGVWFRLLGGDALARAGLRLTPDDTLEHDAGRATFEWYSSAVLVCPRAFEATGSLWLAPCGLAELGRTRASGSATVNPSSDTRAWLAAGAAVLTHWRFYEPLFAEVEGGALVPLIRDRFLIGSAVVHEVPTVIVRGRVGLGVRFE